MSIRSLAASLVCVISASLALSADLPAWKLADVKNGDLANWSAPAKDGERACRTASADKSAVITVPAWWGEGFRPAEDTVYILKVVYKDVLTEPAVFSSHAGLAGYWGLSEVHRFGGDNDGAWKTADIPLSWDLVCRKNIPQQGPGPNTQLAIHAKKDLPVESITVTPAGPGAAEKYFTETRAWIARAQAEKLKTADRGPKQQPVIETTIEPSPLLPFARTYLVPLMQNAAPQKGEAGAALKLKMATNEYEPAAFGVYAYKKDLKGVTYKVGPLTGPSGTLACELDLRTAEYAVVAMGGKGNEGKFQTFPQRLWPAYPVDIAAGQSHLFWLTAHTLGDKSKPGKYAGTVEISADGAAGKLPIEVEVLPVHLLTMQEAGLELGSCGFCSLQEQRDLAAHNHTGMDIWFGGTQPQMKVAGGKLTCDWTYMDDWMAHATKVGWTHMMWFMGGDPYGFPDTCNLERDICQAGLSDRKTFISKANAESEKVLPEIRPLYVDFFRQLGAHAKQKNWPGKLIVHPFDEPAKWAQSHAFNNPYAKVRGAGPWIKPHFQDACALIREGAKGCDNILTGGDMHHAAPSLPLLKDVDVFCTNAIHEDAALGDKVRAAGVQFWQYSGCGDASPAHQGRFAFGFFFGAYRSTGFLIWAYNSCGRFDTSNSHGWGYGWYTPFGTAVTPYMVGVREGADDRRWIETYRKAAGEAGSKALLDEIGKEAIGQRAAGGRDTVNDFFAEVQRHEKMDQWRDKIMAEIVKARK